MRKPTFPIPEVQALLDSLDMVAISSAYGHMPHCHSTHHSHRCPSCHHLWAHTHDCVNLDSVGFQRAHTCPKCGTLQTWKNEDTKIRVGSRPWDGVTSTESPSDPEDAAMLELARRISQQP